MAFDDVSVEGAAIYASDGCCNASTSSGIFPTRPKMFGTSSSRQAWAPRGRQLRTSRAADGRRGMYVVSAYCHQATERDAVEADAGRHLCRCLRRGWSARSQCALTSMATRTRQRQSWLPCPMGGATLGRDAGPTWSSENWRRADVRTQSAARSCILLNPVAADLVASVDDAKGLWCDAGAARTTSPIQSDVRHEAAREAGLSSCGCLLLWI